MKQHSPALPSPEAIVAWGRLIRVSRQLIENVEDALAAANLPALAWYDALHEIAEAGEQGLRPFELAGRMLLAQYNMSRLLTRLERAGLIERREAENDGRGQTIRITPAGRDIRRRMWKIYGPKINALLQAKLSDAEITGLSEILGQVRMPRASD
jgi:DNA-binding MarR family transcriptional regulator